MSMADAAPAPACTLVVFGALGDLARRLLIPALYNLTHSGLLPDQFTVLGIARADFNDAGFRHELADSTREYAAATIDADTWSWLDDRLEYLQGDFDSPETYDKLGKRLQQIGTQHDNGGNVLFYLATPPSFFSRIVDHLGEAGLVNGENGGFRRVIIEKPFGTDLESAKALDKKILGVLDESQIYRIDHYLGKETVQNIMALRFANGIFEPVWNRDHIDHVQITVAETVGVERRGKFYDATGALRDMVPNHLFQLLTLTAMEPPSCFDADAVRSEKSKVLDAVHELSGEETRRNAVRGQYREGVVAGKKVAAYRDAPDVKPDSDTETYVALKLMIDNWRWAGVPFYLRTGKALTARRTEIVIEFKHAPLALFRDTPVEHLSSNDMILHIQPDEGVSLRFSAKVPGPGVRMGTVDMKFNYRDYFKVTPATGYETLIYDAMIGDATLFQRADNIEAGWRVVQPVLDAWADSTLEPQRYRAGTAGPGEADMLLERDGRQWRTIRS
ncbi:MAG TPA: glucose-6-phosphate dehydrogenase [Gammaproteobacteria bacterium]|nr:glucose-6-phosphate dehydrogenase [Gammaproteobacteria bacterium]